MKQILVGDRVNMVHVKVDALISKFEVEKKEMSVLGVSDHFICLDNDLFTKLANSKTFKFCNPELEKVSISEKNSDFDIKYFGKFSITIYSTMTMKRIESKINREFNKWLSEKVSMYGQAKKVSIKI